MNDNWLVYRRDVNDNYDLIATSRHEHLEDAKAKARSEYKKQDFWNMMFFDFVVRHWLSNEPVFSAMRDIFRQRERDAR